MKPEDLCKLIEKAICTKKTVVLEDSVDTLPEWDSVGHLGILVALDKKLGGRASKIKTLSRCQSVSAIFDTLKQNKL